MHHNEMRQTLAIMKRALARNELSYARTSGGETPPLTVFKNRVLNTLEVMVSKIFPAGAGWQAASVLAAQLGYAATDPALFVATGLGDALGVMVGHMSFMVAKRQLFAPKMNLTHQWHTSILLGTAAFCSGSAWQPVLNFLHGSGLDFNSCLIGTGVFCGTAFFAGLRLGRSLYSSSLEGIAAPSYSNLKGDVGLSAAIGGAAGCFVGTDVSFADANWLKPTVGIEATVPPVDSCVIAGTSTSIGFVAVQTAENLLLRKGKNWVD
jgi:hypothetical protein